MTKSYFESRLKICFFCIMKTLNTIELVTENHLNDLIAKGYTEVVTENIGPYRFLLHFFKNPGSMLEFVGPVSYRYTAHVIIENFIKQIPQRNFTVKGDSDITFFIAQGENS